MTLFVARRNFTARVMWIMDKIFKYTNFGWVAWMHDDFFILAGKEFRERSLQELRTHLRGVFKPKNRRCLVLFPEGGFLRKRKRVSQAFAKKNDLRHLENVTLPRTGALEVILKDLAPSHKSRAEKAAKLLANGGSGASVITQEEDDAGNKEITKVVDVTIAYPEGRPLDLLTIAIGYRRPCTTHVHYRVFDIKDVRFKFQTLQIAIHIY